MSVNMVTNVAPPYVICGIIGHIGNQRNMIFNGEPSLQDVNYSAKGNPYSNTYNYGWRDHPNSFIK